MRKLAERSVGLDQLLVPPESNRLGWLDRTHWPSARGLRGKPRSLLKLMRKVKREGDPGGWDPRECGM